MEITEQDLKLPAEQLLREKCGLGDTYIIGEVEELVTKLLWRITKLKDRVRVTDDIVRCLEEEVGELETKNDDLTEVVASLRKYGKF